MNELFEKYQAVIGLEVHAQLLTKSKAYSSDSTEFGGMPNSNVSVITLGHPGTLPRVNKSVIDYAIKLGLACGCKIRERNEYARKNYFYADLPKGYQITQDTTPICNGGKITIKLENGETKDIGITRIHMEEDAGKSMHDVDPYDTLVDLNRAGVPLLEIVSEPDIRSAEEAYAYLAEVRKLLRYLEICDGNMEEGSMRCDANISVMLKGAKEFGNRVEVKNMNSLRNVQRAIRFEIERQITEVEAGGVISQDTRSFDAMNGTTFVMRSKEQANDYRYFPEPDLTPVIVDKAWIEEIRSTMPALPNELHEKFTKEFGLNEYDAGVLTESKPIALYFNELTSHTTNYKAASNWVTGDIKSYLNEFAIHMEDFPVQPETMAKLIALIDDGKVSHSATAQKLFPALCQNPTKEPLELAKELDLIQESDSGQLEEWVDAALAAYPDKVEEYRGGKKGVLGLFMGEVMKMSKGKADPKLANAMVRKKLEG
ncbi:MAG: Asp-tRNA(Asn)/Glu-tRNA(Gln) amidotransferase subunit GatB [Flavobacteriales bacterium]|nr:Asp-tRNA(Asn)/Glu-tRNA(Gln) amidotransferase subunit GatB [Flavobacteriales bacterium]